MSTQPRYEITVDDFDHEDTPDEPWFCIVSSGTVVLSYANGETPADAVFAAVKRADMGPKR